MPAFVLVVFFLLRLVLLMISHDQSTRKGQYPKIWKEHNKARDIAGT